jgi:hypothetical protein
MMRFTSSQSFDVIVSHLAINLCSFDLKYIRNERFYG